MNQGPNVRKLIVHKMSLIAIPSGGGVMDGVKAISTPGRIVSIAKEATEWVKAALDAVKTAPDNPYGDDDEAIAKEIMVKIRELKVNQYKEAGVPDTIIHALLR